MPRRQTADAHIYLFTSANTIDAIRAGFGTPLLACFYHELQIRRRYRMSAFTARRH